MITKAEADAIKAAVQVKLESKDYVNISKPDFDVYVRIKCYDEASKGLDHAMRFISTECNRTTDTAEGDYMDDYHFIVINKAMALLNALDLITSEDNSIHVKPS